MSDPEETPAQAVERLQKEISELRRLRANMPMLILEPYVEDSIAHIKEVAARLAVKPSVPAAAAIEGLREKLAVETQPRVPEATREFVEKVGTGAIWMPEGLKALIINAIPTGQTGSPEKYLFTILTADGRLMTVPAEELGPLGAAAPAAPAATKLSPGSRVKVKTTGKTGYLSELAETTAIVALDEGGFLTVPIADLEPI